MHWTLKNNNFELEINIPPNTTANINIPTSNLENVQESGNIIKEMEDIKFIEYKDYFACYEIGSGNFKFSSNI